MPDFRQIAATTDRYNFHTHTQFCDGRSPVADTAACAVAAGLQYLGFSPHSPIHIPSPCNMSWDDVPVYRRQVSSLAAKYHGQCRIYTGMEVDYLDTAHGPASPVIQDLGLDYTIGSVHFIKTPDGEFVDIDGHFDAFARKVHTYFGGSLRYVVEAFFDASEAMLAQGGFDILGHFDKIAQNASYFQPGVEELEWFDAPLQQYISHIIASGVTVEINTKAYAEHHRFFPHPRHWHKLKQAGVCLIVNSDAHYADRITASRDIALDLLQ